MAHFAQLDQSGIVIRVLVINDQDCMKDGVEDEKTGVEFCQRLFGSHTRWVQTSYNRGIRKNYAGKGFVYDVGLDAFLPPRPYPSWVLNRSTYLWDPPTPRPTDGKKYSWNETTRSWQEGMVITGPTGPTGTVSTATGPTGEVSSATGTPPSMPII